MAEASLEDLVAQAYRQIKNSDWLEKNPATGPRIFTLPPETSSATPTASGEGDASGAASSSAAPAASPAAAEPGPSLDDLLDQLVTGMQSANKSET
eukprot:tig00020723_g13425.t1